VPNSATPTPGNTALLDEITLGTLGTRDYHFGPAGHLDEIVSGAVTTSYQHSPEGQLTDIGTLGARSTMTYDGRGFLRQAEKPAFSIFEDSFETVDTSCWSDAVPGATESSSTTGGPGCFTPGTAVTTTATYGSEGLLYSLLRSTGERHHVLYFAGRPVAQLRIPTAGAATYSYLTTDHLGTPILAMNQAGTTLWRGGFEPFGADWNGASAAGVFLRFPGQWDDSTWAEVGAAGLSYNLNRWYERGTGSYMEADPFGGPPEDSGGLPAAELELFYGYAGHNPMVFTDPLGLLRVQGCTPDRTAAINQAFESYCALLAEKDFELCLCERPDIVKKLRRFCADNSRRIVICDSVGSKDCAGNCGWTRVPGRRTRLCENAWLPEKCGPLGCTIIHELTHQAGHVGEQWPVKVEGCLGCS
jgi:RHS repeat-associated protein